MIILTHLVAASVGACFGFAAAAVLMMGKISDLEKDNHYLRSLGLHHE